MRNITGQAVIGDDLFGREFELEQLWEKFDQGEHLLMLAPRRIGKTSLMLELRRVPRQDWDVIYVDLEAGDSAADCIAAILARLASKPEYRTWMEAIPFRESLKNLLRNTSVSVQTDAMRVEFKGALIVDWEHAAEQLFARLARLPNPEGRLIIVLDELPLLVSRLLKDTANRSEAEVLLSRLREMRQTPDLRNRVHTLIGGSTGLEGVLRRVGLSGLINDLSQFRVGSWDRPTAIDFLSTLGRDCNFPLQDGYIGQILDLLQDPVPYHVQLLFSEIRQTCRSDPNRVSSETIIQCFRDRLTGPSGTSHLDHYAERLETVFTDQENDLAQLMLGRACLSERGASLADVRNEREGDEQIFSIVLRELQVDGYLESDGDRIWFLSGLLREWWRRNQLTAKSR